MFGGTMAAASVSPAQAADDVHKFVKVGDTYPEWTVTVTPEYQATKHRCCGVDTRVFGDMVVHLDQTATQPRPIRLGEPLTVRGKVTAIEPVARGHVIRAVFDFFRADGSLALATTRAGMRFGPTGSQKGSTRPGKPPEEDPRLGLAEISAKQLTPEGVAEYSDGGGPVHKDPAYCRGIGLRAPVAAGVMGMHWMLEALARDKPYQTVDIAITLRRPIFWDERITLWGRPLTGREGACDLMRVLNAEGKVAVSGEVRDIAW